MTIRAQMWKTLTNLFSLRTISTLTKYSYNIQFGQAIGKYDIKFSIWGVSNILHVVFVLIRIIHINVCIMGWKYAKQICPHSAITMFGVWKLSGFRGISVILAHHIFPEAFPNSITSDFLSRVGSWQHTRATIIIRLLQSKW